MDNIFDLNSISVDFDLMERANPVFNTAKMTLFQLTASGNEYAAAIAEKLGLNYENAQNSKSTKVSPEIAVLNNIILETRYKTMAVLAEKSGFPTEVDMPCGYTPRAIEFSKKGIRFVGIDLPAAISEAGPAVTSLIDEDKKGLVRFAGADATNYESVKKALEGIDGEICITTEGLMMYLTDSETGVLCDNIARLLSEHGGCWITADPEVSLQFVLTAQPLFGERFMDIMMKMKSVADDKSDVNVGSNSLVIDCRDAAAGMKKAMMFLAAHGLKAERMTIAENMPEITMLSKVEPQTAAAIKAAMGKCAYWKITLINSSAEIDTSMVKSAAFDAKAVCADGELMLKMTGRVDSINAPKLLSFWENTSAGEKINAVNIDCTELEYISSAGLRVLLIMHKACPGGVTVSGANNAIKEILSQTGFDSILTLI
ncbi:MAG TPA: anti-sigma factor antagonist [Ruminococcaceae bacterium]|nr:anti-sigma factor antagonist [Oscillospiraceae bacterium]